MQGMNQQDIDRIFTYHPPWSTKMAVKLTEVDAYKALRNSGHDMASKILKLTPASAEQTLAIRKVQEAIFWANASIALAQDEEPG